MAPPTLSSKLGLLVDPDGESDIATNNTNWDKVDLASGFMYINSGETPPAQFHGAMVAEKDTGISYMLLSNGAGGWNKKYITYPYQYSASTASTTINTGATTINWGWDTINTSISVNQKAADKEAGTNGWICPVAGLYELGAFWRWNDASVGQLKVGNFQYNGSSELFYTEKRKETIGFALLFSIGVLVELTAGETIRGRIYTSNTGTSMSTVFHATLVRPA